MNGRNLLIMAIVVNSVLIAALLIATPEKTDALPDQPVVQAPVSQPPVQQPPVQQPPEVKKYEPQWTDYPKKSTVSNPKCDTWGDVMSHASGGQVYRGHGPCTEVHETLHGICQRKANQYGFYCMNDRMCYVDNPDTTIRAVAGKVPNSLRGGTYQLYLISQAGQFNSDPIYLFDEWICYAGGAACAIDMTENKGWTQQRWDTVLFMREFDVYCLTLAMVAKPQDEQFKNLLGWCLERNAKLYEEARKHPNLTHQKQDDYVQKWKTSADAEGLRQFTREYLGEEWTKRVLGY